MLEIGRAIVSFDILEKHFLCDLLKCKGLCCLEGDSGAPLTPEEARTIESVYAEVEPYLPREHRDEIRKQGFSVTDSDGDLVTPLVNNRQCVYTYLDEKSIWKCGIERAFLDGKITWRKPVSCHLFPSGLPNTPILMRSTISKSTFANLAANVAPEPGCRSTNS
jgi:hypothetical protein